MAHEVRVELATNFALHKDIEVSVKRDSKKLGTMLISKGNVEWVPAGNSVNKKRLSWTQFAKLIEAEGKDVKI